MSQCQSMDRNFCAPNGKNAALFVDIDGTTIVCQPNFDEAEASFRHFMELRGFKGDEAMEVFHRYNRSNAESEGFERGVYAKTLVDAYRELVTKHRRRIPDAEKLQDERILRSIGSMPFFREPVPFPNAAAVLGRAHHNFLIFAVSIGSREAQKYKVRQSGLNPVFDELIITSRDDKMELVQQVIEDWNIDPKLSAFVGNSRRSDGACLAVTNFVYLPLEGGWAFDVSADLPENTGFECFPVRNWREAEEKGLNRLVRRRKSQRLWTPAEKDGDGCGKC